MVEISETENDIPKDILELAVDSGTEVHIIPLKLVSKLMRWITGPDDAWCGWRDHSTLWTS